MICTGAFTTIVSHEIKTGTTENGTSVFSPPVNIAGKIKRKQMNNIFGENENFKYQTFFYAVSGFSINTGDKINGLEVVEKMDTDKYLLN